MNQDSTSIWIVLAKLLIFTAPILVVAILIRGEPLIEIRTSKDEGSRATILIEPNGIGKMTFYTPENQVEKVFTVHVKKGTAKFGRASGGDSYELYVVEPSLNLTFISVLSQLNCQNCLFHGFPSDWVIIKG